MWQARRAPARVVRAAFSRAIREQDGQAMVEFAIVVTLLLMIVTGIVYFGRYMNDDITLNHMANVGARWAAVNGNPSGGSLDNYVASLAPSGTSSNITVFVYPNSTTGSTAQVNQPITACVVMTNPLGKIPFTNFLPGKIVRSATMRSETTWTTPDSEPNAVAQGCPS
jgi:Flp pilus assembly protein TadG